MKKVYQVKIEEKLTYYIEVEAESKEEAIELAYVSEKFTRNFPDDNDSDVTEVECLGNTTTVTK